MAIYVTLEGKIPRTPSKLINKVNLRDKVELVFALEECQPIYVKDANGYDVETYSNHWPCLLPKDKIFTSSRARVTYMLPNRSYCPPSNEDIAALKSRWSCINESWQLRVKKNRKESTFTATYFRVTNAL